MQIPDEDLGPVWLRDYGSLYRNGDLSAAGDGGTGVRGDLSAMDQFAAALEQNLHDDYEPHARKVLDDLSVRPEGTPGFAELQAALAQQDEVSFAASDNVANHGNGALVFAIAMKDISERYRQTDAFAAATLTDIQAHLGLSPDQLAATGTDPTPDVAEGV